MEHDRIRAVRWDGSRLELLDQRLLPGKEKYLSYENAVAVARAIRDMVVRGAPAIGVTAAYGVALAARTHQDKSGEAWHAAMREELQRLETSRPTAVNLFWALNRMRGVLAPLDGGSAATLRLAEEAVAIHDEDIAANRRTGELGAALIAPGKSVITHCNTGSLATGGFGTALGVIRAAYGQKRIEKVYADETRPWLQGARLTAWELVQDRIPAELIVEGAAASLLKSGRIGWVIVGADRIAANGDAANKIGTYGLAILARHHGARFMVVAPTSTVDMEMANGEGIPIESRDPEEVLSWGGQRVAAAGVGAWNPVFDVTPAELIDAIVTERGVVEYPTREKMARMMAA